MKNCKSRVVINDLPRVELEYLDFLSALFTLLCKYVSLVKLCSLFQVDLEFYFDHILAKKFVRILGINKIDYYTIVFNAWKIC
jgi:hypothetical protein